MSDLKMTNAGDYMRELDEEGKWEGYPNAFWHVQHAGCWIIGGSFHISVPEGKKPTPEQIKNTEDLLGWKWEPNGDK